MKYDRRPFKPQLQPTQTQSRSFQELFIDLFSIEGKYYLTILDAFSKLAQAFEIPDRSTPEVVRALIKYFSFYGVPTKISSDPGSEFNNKLMKDLMTLYKIEIHIGTLYHLGKLYGRHGGCNNGSTPKNNGLLVSLQNI